MFNYGQSREQYILRSQLSMGDLRLLTGPSLKEVAFGDHTVIAELSAGKTSLFLELSHILKTKAGLRTADFLGHFLNRVILLF